MSTGHPHAPEVNAIDWAYAVRRAGPAASHEDYALALSILNDDSGHWHLKTINRPWPGRWTAGAPSPKPEEKPTMGTELAQRATNDPPTALALTGVEAVRHAMEELKAIRTFVHGEMAEGVDFGVIPGTGAKPTLLLPGAQKIAMYFNTYPEYAIQPTELGEGHVEYVVTARLLSRSTREVVGSGLGSCSTMEGKYRFRTAARLCPECGKDAIIRGKEEFGGGWLCFKKKGGCGAKFPAGDRAIEGQAAGKVENDNVHDQRNTVLKMAKKRAVVDAAHALGCLSELFTQDIEDFYDLGQAEEPRPAPTRDDRKAELDRDFTPAEPPPSRAELKVAASLKKTWASFSTDALAATNDALHKTAREAGLPIDLKAQACNVHQLHRHLLKWNRTLRSPFDGPGPGVPLQQRDAALVVAGWWDNGNPDDRAEIRAEVARYLAEKTAELLGAAKADGPTIDAEPGDEAAEVAVAELAEAYRGSGGGREPGEEG